MDPSERFRAALEHLRQDAWGGIQLLYLDLAFNRYLSRNKDFLNVANQTPVFWNTTRHGWQCGYMIALGRAYDHKTQHNVTALLDLFSNNLDMFSKSALADRKRADSPNADEWLPDYLQRVHVPNVADVKRLKVKAKEYQDLYNAKYRPLRNKVFAHRALGARKEVVKLYSATKISELQKLFVYLLKLHLALRELYQNGRRPILKPLKFSLAALMRDAKKWPATGQVHEAVVAEVKELLELLRTGSERGPE